jgi:carboxyl-terminal processing protease
MPKKIKYLGTALLVASLLSFTVPRDNYYEIVRSLDIFATLFREVNAYYVDEINPEKLIRKGIEGMLSSLDPYTDFIAEEEAEGFRIATTGQYAGIGALIGTVNNRTVITHPYKNFPAYNAGIRVGDEIIAVDGQSTAGKSTAEISNMLRGQLKSVVEIRLKRHAHPQEIVLKIKRERITISNISFAEVIAPGIGYIKLDDFTPGAAREVAHALSKLKQKGAQKLILDLRDNPGGMLHEAVNIVNLFIPKGKTVVMTKGKMPDWNRTYTTLNTPLDVDIPLVVMINGGSASASEIVAGALQDYDRALLIGQKTFGKGLVQTTRPLAYNAQLKVTTARYYIPSGRCIQELDYAHRNADGTAIRVADSTKKIFFTANGRMVLDGGGLKPDIELGTGPEIPLLSALINSGLIFDYAVRFTNEKPAPPSIASFFLSDKDYEAFVSWVKSKNFTYTTRVESEIQDFLEKAKNEPHHQDLVRELKELRTRLDAIKSSDFTRFQTEIKRVLEQQIAFHYNLYEWQVPVALRYDNEIEKAREILSSPEKYTSLLKPN